MNEFNSLFYAFSADGLGITIVSNTFPEFILVMVVDAAVVTQIEVSVVTIINSKMNMSNIIRLNRQEIIHTWYWSNRTLHLGIFPF
jgi:hypothetical protein